MGKLWEWTWALATCWILLDIYYCEVAAFSTATDPEPVTEGTTTIPTTVSIETTPTAVDKDVELVYYSAAKSSQLIFFSKTSGFPAYNSYTISVRPDPAYLPGDGRDFKVLVALEGMVCESSNINRTHLWIQDGSGNQKEYCQNLKNGNQILSEGYGEVKIGRSEYWDTDVENNATIRVTAYYDSAANCRCTTSLSFCCEPCPEETNIAEDSRTGYCINKDFRCNYYVYCPCGAKEIPNVDHCDWFPEENLIHVSISLMMIYFVLGVCAAVGVIYFLPYLCRRTSRRPLAQQAQAGPHQRQHPDAECPPSYESTAAGTVEEYSLKHLHILDEPPPPSYETIVKN